MERQTIAVEKKLAVLIDADNVSPNYVQYIFAEAVNHGTPTIKRIYGDWTRPELARWKEPLLEYSVTPMQQYGYTSGKNSTDSALIIDAMDILYAGNVDGFCIVSSDSDFTKLASRLRESGMYVVGMGEKKTPKPFVRSCERFIYLENLEEPLTENHTHQKRNELNEESCKLLGLIKRIVSEQDDESGWVSLGKIGTILMKRYPDFDARNYGHSNLSKLVMSFDAFDIDVRNTSNRHSKLYFIKNRD